MKCTLTETNNGVLGEDLVGGNAYVNELGDVVWCLWDYNTGRKVIVFLTSCRADSENIVYGIASDHKFTPYTGGAILDFSQ